MRKLYNSFLDSGDLLILYPKLTGVWEKDEEEFTNEMKISGGSLVSEDFEEGFFYDEDEFY